MSEVFYDSIKQLQSAYLMFPAFQTSFERMDANLRLFRQTGIAQNLLVLGESGTGKTTLARMFTEGNPRQRLLDRDVIPVLNVSVPAAATIAGTVEAILTQLGDLQPERGTISVKTARAVKLAKGCSVEMLVFDEAQHIQDRGKTQSQYFVGDWLKSFIDALSLPVTLLGLPRTQGLLQVNEQLRRRFSHRLSLSIEAGEQEPNENSSIGLFTSLAEALPLPLNPKPHSWKELGLRLHFATQGRIAYVKQILVHAYSCAVENGNDCITTNELASAFTASIWPAGIGPLNPFDPSFQWRALDRNGEPFQLGDVGAAQPSRRKR
ncbi:TniB family NTP-binding protein [Comamonas composti]|uniref:TniB family NTP-binding protein n=1 Tax=Comamonas composti TaxID=408558 RepID=UPI0004099FA6|nr:TniB family NTP-binding protein [Comamonas composti]